MPEPSVLDYLKAKLMPWRGPAPEIPEAPKPRKSSKAADAKAAKPAPKAKAGAKAAAPAKKRKAAAPATGLAVWPWRSVMALVFFLFAQLSWPGPDGSVVIGALFFLIGVAFFVLAAREDEWRLPQPEQAEQEAGELVLRRVPLGLALAFFALTFVSSGGNRFTFINVSFWIASVALILYALWQTAPDAGPPQERLRNWWQSRFGEGGLNLSLSRWTLLLLAAMAVAFFFRFYQLSTVPPEMTSDHAEKLYDVLDVVNGQYSIFFPRNTGREPMQFYLTAAVAKLFGTGVSFLSLKIGTALVGFLSLIYIYLLGKELGGRWVGFFALLLTGVAYWPNVLSRAALRFALYPGFAAPTLYYLLRGFRRARLNDFLLAGVFMGAGLLGYTPFRAVPIAAVGALAIYLLHKPEAESRRRVLIGFAMMALVSLVIVTPLLRYAIDNPEIFNYRMLTRMGTVETQYPGSPILIFFSNLVKSLGMVNINAGNIWLVGLTGRPALDLISASLFLLGLALVIWRYLRSRGWLDLFLLAAYPILMLPSILALAFPQENPALNRAGGALIVVFIICAMGLDALLHGLRDRLGEGRGLQVAVGLGAVVFLGAGLANYSMVFDAYQRQYKASSWNTSEMGGVIASFADGVGSLDQAWVVPYPYWVDTRLVAFNAGYPGHDYGLWPDQLDTTLDAPYPKLFLLRPEDSEGLATLQALYPQGTSSLFDSEIPDKDFLIYFVAPPTGN